VKVKTLEAEMADKLEWTGERFVPEVEGGIALEHIHRYALACEFAEDKVVLDIASGEGYGSAMLSRYARQVLGIDISERAVAFSRKKYVSDNLTFVSGSCSEIPLGDGSVDMIVSFETIEHHDQHEAMIKEFARVLRPDGVVIISSPDKHEYSDEPQYKNPYHVKELYKNEFEGLLSRYFQHLQMYGQRLIYGSGIFLCDDQCTLIQYLDSKGDITGKKSAFKPIYNIAIASNVDLSMAISGFMEGDVCDSEAHRLKVNERELWWQAEVERIAGDYKNEIARIGRERDNMLVQKDKDWQEEVGRVSQDCNSRMEFYTQHAPLVSIIIVNYNGKHFFNALLPSITGQTYPNYEVVLVDNASIDGSVDYIRSQYPDIRVVEAGENLGFAAGNNLGIEVARGEFYALINNDTVVDPDWLGALVSEIQSDTNLAAVGSKIVFFEPFITLNISSQVVTPGEAQLSGDGRELGLLFSESSGFEDSSYRKRIYLDGFYAEECIDGQAARWTNGGGAVAVPVETSQGGEDAVLKLVLAGGGINKGSVFEVKIGDESLGGGVLDEEFKEYRFTISQELIRGESRNIINNAGSLLDDKGNAKDRGMNEIDCGQYDNAEDVQALCGGAMLVRKSAIEKVGPFDASYFMYYEDTELSWRLRRAGYCLRYQPTSVVRHIHAGSSEEWSPTFKYYVWRNRILMCVTHTSITNATKVYLREWVAMAQLLRTIVAMGRKRNEERQAVKRDLWIKLLIQRSLFRQIPKAFIKKLKLRNSWERRKLL
jgi:GT2 family glycosyltransferase/SAM-dependent methyltransferase